MDTNAPSSLGEKLLNHSDIPVEPEALCDGILVLLSFLRGNPNETVSGKTLLAS